MNVIKRTQDDRAGRFWKADLQKRDCRP